LNVEHWTLNIDKRRSEVRTVRLLIQYDGTEYVGWQRQPTGPSIQGVLEEALGRIEGRAVAIHGAGRTDAGVHAEGQVASARISSPLDDATLMRALNANLPATVRVQGVDTAADDFHARFSAVAKTYEYRIWNGAAVPPFLRLYTWQVPQPLDLDLLRSATAALPGTHDFSAFQGSGTTTNTPVRTIVSAQWHDARPAAPLVFEITGRGFLRHMVRSLAGTLVEIGLQRRPAGDIARLLESGCRSDVGRTAPPCGLFLVRVDY
jgi:tRNA pseudouridine38-40 synthase